MNRLTPFDQKIKELKEKNEGGLALYLPLRTLIWSKV